MRKFYLAAVAALLLSTAADAATPQRCKDLLDCIFNAPPRHQATGTLQDPALQVKGVRDQYGHPITLTGASRREEVAWDEDKYPAGSILVKTSERSLYYVEGDGRAMKYAIGVGREGFQWSGTSQVASKAEWPDWTPPKQMIEREAKKGHHIPDHMNGGPGNPLGARAMYLAGRLYRIHGTNNEASIGGAVSSGCIRMMNADVIDLYERTKVGAKVWVYQ